eukprot:Gregarina_sp_Poly_1__1861@NODE_1485_length_4019_cov_34_970648_g577_i1_p2_GENE_NODE_1485_length_4019_cov_34_970648_g577_i1NODE_1485_length_4019_cov_34_970648_g577_i1_p2_ORF_typecomplete_len200_score24_28_NODE_1485_length_4019_cov_34_970648_g577_i134064005
MNFLSVSDPSPGADAIKRDNHLHDDSCLMVPPAGFKFVPRTSTICGKAGCFECFDIYCDRCESKDRRIIELELRNSDLVKYLTQLQGKFFGRISTTETPLLATGTQRNDAAVLNDIMANSRHDAAGIQQIFRSAAPAAQQPFLAAPNSRIQSGPPPDDGKIKGEAFAYIQSPVLYDPNLNITYVATTTFAPANVGATTT